MGAFHKFALIHKGEVVSVGSGEACVMVDVGATGHSCSACTLGASCSQNNVGTRHGSVLIRARILPEADIPEEGMIVSVGLPCGGTMNATVVMFVLPLVSLLLVALGGTLLKISDGVVAVSALFSAAICYFVLYFIYRRKYSPWILISGNQKYES